MDQEEARQPLTGEARLAAYLDAIAGVLGHARRAAAAQAYCTGLLLHDRRMGWRRSPFHAIHRVVAGLGIADPPAMPTRGRQMAVTGAPPEWMAWVERWYDTSTLTPTVRHEYRGILAKVGRWLAAEQPAVAAPADWTREVCAAWVARVIPDLSDKNSLAGRRCCVHPLPNPPPSRGRV
jgi:hypothetical protein